MLISPRLHFSVLLVRGNSDILVVGQGMESHATHESHGTAHDNNDGVSRGIGEPVLLDTLAHVGLELGLKGEIKSKEIALSNGIGKACKVDQREKKKDLPEQHFGEKGCELPEQWKHCVF
jgi:hypothetical protein